MSFVVTSNKQILCTEFSKIGAIFALQTLNEAVKKGKKFLPLCHTERGMETILKGSLNLMKRIIHFLRCIISDRRTFAHLYEIFLEEYTLHISSEKYLI